MLSVTATSQPQVSRFYKAILSIRNDEGIDHSLCSRNRSYSLCFNVLQRLSRSIFFSRKSSLSISIRNEANRNGEAKIQVKVGVVIVDHGSRRQESNLMLNDLVAMFKRKTDYQIVEPAHLVLAEPTIKDAFRVCVQHGINQVIVCPFFLSPGRHWYKDIPALVAEAAGEHSGISYIITAPLGLHELMVDVMNDRIMHCLSHVAGKADECPSCVGTGRCRLY